MDNRSILIALHHIEGIGWKTIGQIVRRCPQLTEALQLDSADWRELGFSQAKADALAGTLRMLTAERFTQLEQQYSESAISILTIYDEEYPLLLKQTSQPPWVMYFRGNPGLMNRMCIAVVGTRTPTVYGRKITEQLSEALAEAQICIVSGLARGIDSSAHEGALRREGGTIAVLGCGIDKVYPPENKALYRQIAERGLLLSEYPLNTKPHPGLFPQRNRIIAGLSKGVLVVEAALRSGSLITVDQALEESRDIFAVPGPVTSPKSLGTHALIKQGAKLVGSVEDILEEYGSWISKDITAYSNSTKEQMPPLTDDEQKVIDLLQTKPLSIDELLTGSQFTFGHLHSVLLNLLLTKRVEQLPGSTYAVY